MQPVIKQTMDSGWEEHGPVIRDKSKLREYEWGIVVGIHVQWR